jgi:hypothetical protein
MTTLSLAVRRLRKVWQVNSRFHEFQFLQAGHRQVVIVFGSTLLISSNSLAITHRNRQVCCRPLTTNRPENFGKPPY